jgi:prepilin signal peptidase PulO-like enzyme (type II secretory pathway)
MIEILILVIGLCFGSFINMLVFRTMCEKQITRNKFQETNNKRSCCDHCGKKLNWWNNVPVLSFLFQRGKSQCCGKKLDVSYPIVEIIMGILFLLNFYFLISNFYSIFNFYFLISNVIVALMVYSAVYDAKTMYLPDWSTWALIFLAIIYQIMGRPVGPPMLYLLNIVYSAMGASLFLYLLSLIKIRGVEGMGKGDVLLAIFMGLLLGYPNIIVAFYVAFIIGAVFGIVYLWIFKGKNKSTMIPFGPFLLLGTLVAWWWGEGLWYYFSNLVI